MADSGEIFFPISKRERYRVAQGQFPFKRHMSGWNSSTQADDVWLPPIDVQSPLTGAGFKIQPVGFFNPAAEEVGYLVKINIPACTIGNNTQLDNSAIATMRIAQLLLQYALRQMGASMEAVGCLDANTAELWSLTPTFFLDGETHEGALALLGEFARQSEAIHNTGGRRPPAFGVGSTKSATRYIRLSDHKVSAYVKEPDGKKPFFSAPTKEVGEYLYAGAACLLRVEVKLGKQWLRKRKLSMLANWRRGSGRDPYVEVYTTILKALHATHPLRNSLPSEVQLAKLSPDYRAVFQWYVDGNDPRAHAIIAGHGSALKGQMKYSRYRARIRDVTGFDMDIPFAKHAKEISPRLIRLLLAGSMKPMEEVLRLTFSRETAKIAVDKLEGLLANFDRERAKVDDEWRSAPAALSDDRIETSISSRHGGRGIGRVRILP